MNILIAPDKFKGSLTAQEVCDAVKDALLEIDPTFSITTIPMADGGEGTCELLTQHTGGSIQKVTVHDPLFRRIESGYGISKDGRVAFLEMAKASGLQLLKKEERNPTITTSLGTGELLRDALDRGVTKITMGIGGSATNDAGIGMAEALGIKFLSHSGERLKPIGGNLDKIETMDIGNLHPRLKEVEFVIFCDVDNPLHGKNGAAWVFAPQKGASTEEINMLDNGLRRYETVLERTFGVPVNFPGAGAGGGLPATLKALTRVEVQRGMDFIISFINIEDAVRKTDMIITGEGKIDEQTLAGKVVEGIAGLARKYHKPVYAVAGVCEITPAQRERMGIAKVICLQDGDTDEKYSMTHARDLLKQRILEHAAVFRK